MSITVQAQYGSYVFETNYADVEKTADIYNQKPQIGQAARFDGGRAGNGFLGTKRFTCSGVVGGDGITSQDQLRTYVDALRYAHRGGRRKFYRDSDRYLRDVQVVTIGMPEDTGLLWAPYTIEYEAANPYWYAVTLDTDAWSGLSTGATRTIANGGVATALPIFTITPSGAGTLDFDLYNDSLLPGAPTLTGSGTGGGLAAATYWIKTAWELRDGTTVPGTAASDTRSGSTSKITVAHATAPEDAVGWYVYAGTGASEPALSAMWLQHTFGPLTIGKDFVLRSLVTSGTPGTRPAVGVIRLDGAVAANDILVVDCDRQIVTLNADLAMSYFDGSFFPLLPGNNSMRVVYSGATLDNIATEFQKRYL